MKQGGERSDINSVFVGCPLKLSTHSRAQQIQIEENEKNEKKQTNAA